MFEVQLTKFWISVACIALVGVSMVCYGSSLPAYHDVDAANRIIGNAMVDGKCGPDSWYQQMDRLRTGKYPIQNAGWSLIMACLALAFGGFFLIRKKFENVSNWRTPSQKWHFFLLGIILVMISFLGSIYGLSLDLSREQFPSCADSIGIPIYSMMIFYSILLLVLLLIGGIISMMFGRLPVAITYWDTNNPLKSWSVTLLFFLIFLMLFYATISASKTADFVTVFPGVLAMYLTLSTRSALLAPK